jgi:hypothetical protein
VVNYASSKAGADRVVAEITREGDELSRSRRTSPGRPTSHGALLRLREIDIGRGGVPRSLLDEVDCIAGISGGAFTAAYYGLFGTAGLDTFYDRFLKRNLHVELGLRVLNPVNLVRLASPYFSRIDLAAELYDETVFEGRKSRISPRGPSSFCTRPAWRMASRSSLPRPTSTSSDLISAKFRSRARSRPRRRSRSC